MFDGQGDMASINIQRGRDTGLRNYNDYRRLCNLTPVTSFDAVCPFPLWRICSGPR